MRWPWLIAALAGCSTPPPSGDIVGPFTGAPHRFVVDGLTLPTSFDMARELADDLNGDNNGDNEVGSLMATLAGQNDASLHQDAMIASGVIGSVVIIQADDLDNDPAVGVTYHGVDGDDATVMGGALVDGKLLSNRSRTTHIPGAATLLVPIFADADPAVLELRDMEIDLAADGRGGFDAIVRGGVPAASVDAALLAGIRQMLAADPAAHGGFARILDANFDGVITDDEITGSPLLDALVAPDLSGSLLSLAIGVHLSPCASGSCAPMQTDPCFDRVRDGDETAVDCGGATCMPCGPTLACKVASDCQTAACDGTMCRAASCSDGVENGFETGVDCGGLCPGCAGDTCAIGQECASGTCLPDANGGLGACMPTSST